MDTDITASDTELRSLLDLIRDGEPDDAPDRTSVVVVGRLSALDQDFDRFEAAVRHLLDSCSNDGAVGAGAGNGAGMSVRGSARSAGVSGRVPGTGAGGRWYSGVMVLLSDGTVLHYLEGPDDAVKRFLRLLSREPWMAERLREAKVVAHRTIMQPLCARWSVAAAEVEGHGMMGGGMGDGMDGGITSDEAVRAMASIAGAMESLAGEMPRLAETDGALRSLNAFFNGLPPPEDMALALAAPQAPSVPEFLAIFDDPAATAAALLPLRALLEEDVLAM